MRAGVGYSDIPDSAAAGKKAAEQAISMSGRTDPCDLILLFATSRHNQRILRAAVAAVAGAHVPVYGGGAVGIITNDAYGYAGDQVGVACLWLDAAHCDVLTDGGLLESEEDAGFRLGQELARLGTKPGSPVMLFYDAIGQSVNSNVRLLMATRILAGLEKALGFLPELTGAGLQGDHMCSPTNQYTGAQIGEHCAMALAFSGDVHIDSVIMHGCRPASVYYTVTKADGPVILEIDHKPALSFIDELIGSAVAPEQYPFFLMLGINSGERWGEYDEDKYASRLCFGIDRERGGIVMFEPDMVEGTQFQLMIRSLNLDYMQPKFEKLFDQLNGRKPVFGIYINCAGRCAGYNGTDIEDALVLQQAVAGRVPVLGIYTGVEIASIAGRPKGLDWTGVFCLFSQGGGEKPAAGRDRPDSPPPPAAADMTMPPDFVKTLCEQNAAKILALDSNTIMLRYELELKRRGFKLLSELAVSLRQTNDYESMFIKVAQRINAALNMQKTVVLLAAGNKLFTPAVLQGFTAEEKERLLGRSVHIPEALLNQQSAIVVIDDSSECFSQLREEYKLPFFIASPIILQGEMAALLITGRMAEQPPYLTRLGHSDRETVQAITELLGAVLTRLRLQDITVKAETDSLTGLCNRSTFQRQVENYLNHEEDISGVFIMIDLDHFKEVNDTYGHIAGDILLKSCADAMRNTLRSSDIIGRQGGDEFAVFCRGIGSDYTAEKKALQLTRAFNSVLAGDGKPVTASIGLALSPRHGKTFQELYKNADAALYTAKERGRNCYVLFQADK